MTYGDDWSRERRLDVHVPLKNPELPALLRRLADRVESGELAGLALKQVGKTEYYMHEQTVGEFDDQTYGWAKVVQSRS